MQSKKWTVGELIAGRKEQWELKHSVEDDALLVELIAKQITEDMDLFKSVQANPEYLIELCFIVVDKNQKTVPFFLNEVQNIFVNELNECIIKQRNGILGQIDILVLKGRQQGFTSFITAYQLACSLLNINFSGFTLSDSTDNTETIFEDKCKLIYNNLPKRLKPTEKYNTKRQLIFEKTNSKWRVATAGSAEVGRSKTINFFHGSEAAFYKDLNKINAGLGNALTQNSIQILETTANGYNEFKELWDSGAYLNLFFEWWLTSEYTMGFESAKKEGKFRENLTNSQEWIFERIRWLLDTKELTTGQVYWYYNKYLKNPEKIKQEYPCSAEEAFIASGACVFNKEKILQRIDELKEEQKNNPPSIGEFYYEWNNPSMRDAILKDTVRFVEANYGALTIYAKPEPKHPYVIGFDPKNKGADFHGGTVIDNATGERVATFHSSVDPSIAVMQLYCLGRYYSNAIICLESNMGLYMQSELERLGYSNFYVREAFDKMGKVLTKEFGFWTHENSRKMIIEKLQENFREHIHLYNNIETLQEGLSFIHKENGKMEHEDGKHDDLLFSDMMANECRSQQTYYVSVVEKEKPVKLINTLKKAGARIG